jgi:hypothetical protein
MKRTNSVFLLLFIAAVFFLSAANIWAQATTAPAFDKQPSVILDLWANGSKGKYKDNVKVRNGTLRDNIMFNVYGYDEKKKEWTLIGPAPLKYHADSENVDKTKGVNIKDFRWFAVHSLANVPFDAQGIANKSNDVVITILDKVPGIVANPPQGNDAPAFDLQSSTVLDLWASVKGKYKDKINIKNAIGTKNVGINVWGYDQKNNYWSIIGPKRLSPDPAPPRQLIYIGIAWVWYDPATDESVDLGGWKDRIKDFRWIAVQSLDGLPLDVQVSAAGNDLNLTAIKK